MKIKHLSYPILIFYGFTPSIIWLCYYLRKDVHPESNSEVLKVFFYGMLVAIPTALLEIGIFKLSNLLGFSSAFFTFFNVFIGVALVEEVAKYLVVKFEILNNPEFDEPIDAMLYMIIAALGFASVENILILLPFGESFMLKEVISLSGFRFLTATFLHALSSGAIGFFIALSCFENKNRIILVFLGITMATILHGLFNFSIIVNEGRPESAITAIIIILISLAIFVSLGLRKLKKLNSVCKIK